MKTVSAAILALALALSASAEPPKAPPDPALVMLQSRLERDFQKLDAKPTFEIPVAYEGRNLIVRFKTRTYIVHPRRGMSGGFLETTEKREGPSDQGFLLRVQVEQLGEPNQALMPQVIREPYWNSYLSVYPIKGTQKQLYFCLSYAEGTDGTLIENIRKAASESSSQRGERMAREHLAKGTMRILYYGKPWSQGKPMVDDASGLPVKIVAGCCIGRDFAEEIDAYNRVMRDAAKAKTKSGKSHADSGVQPKLLEATNR